MIDDDSPDRAVDAGRAADKPECVRRSVLRGGVVLGAVAIGGALSRIGAGPSGAASLSANSTPTTGTGAPPVKATPVKAAAPGTAPKGKAVGLASKIPVGGGVIFAKAAVVVTQPTAGEYKAFTANCTHEKCLLADVSDGTINCACHGGKFSITDGSAVQFPAIDPLTAKTVTVAGGKLIVS